MRRPRQAALTVGLCAALASAAPLGAEGKTRPARLAVQSERPFVVRGLRFAAAERVTVVLHLDGSRTRRAVADHTGTFRMGFGMSVPRCTRYTVRAWGSKGSRASLITRLGLDCEPDR